MKTQHKNNKTTNSQKPQHQKDKKKKKKKNKLKAKKKKKGKKSTVGEARTTDSCTKIRERKGTQEQDPRGRR